MLIPLPPQEIEAQLAVWAKNGVSISRLTGALSAAIAGGNATDVQAGAQGASVATENNVVPLLIAVAAGAAAFASGYYTTKEVANILNKAAVVKNEIGGEEGAQAAMGVLLQEGSRLGLEIIGVGEGFKVAGKLYPSAREAYLAVTKSIKLPSQVTAKLAASSMSAKKLAEQLSLESASSPFTKEGFLTEDAIKNSRLIIDSSKIRNENLPKGYSKFRTETFQSPSGDFSVHFYKDSTGKVHYDRDYKVIFNKGK